MGHRFAVQGGKPVRKRPRSRSLAPAPKPLRGRRFAAGPEATAVDTPPADPEVEGFLALLATRRAPKTVDAYRRDLKALAVWLDRPVGKITTEQLEQYLAELRAAGLSPSTIARRLSSDRPCARPVPVRPSRIMLSRNFPRP